jgi:thioredoxin-related protein
MKKLILIGFWLAAAGAAVGLLAGCKSGPSASGATSTPTVAGAETIAAGVSREGAKINWLTDVVAARASAEKSGKDLLLYFHTDWCGYCQLMEKNTFSASEIIISLNRDFIAVKIDAEKEAALSRQFDITGYPTTVICDSRGKELARIPGYEPPEQYLKSIAAYGRR